MTKEEEFAVLVFQKAPSPFIKEQARLALQTNNEDMLVKAMLNAIKEYENLKDWYVQILGEELYAELQKFKTEG